MKSSLTLILSIFTIFSFAQNGSSKIDTSNYYEYAKSAGNLNWLRTSDAVPVIIDELKQAGFSHAFIGVGELMKINDTTHLVLTVSYKNDTRFGFVYDAVHRLPLNKKDREFMASDAKQGFTQSERNLT